MSNHTPGPWAVKADSICPQVLSDSIGTGYYGILASVTQRDPHPQHGGGIPMATTLANARLIAASPDLLNMLQRMLDETSGGGVPCLLTLEHARNAIAKATGGAA